MVLTGVVNFSVARPIVVVVGPGLEGDGGVVLVLLGTRGWHVFLLLFQVLLSTSWWQVIVIFVQEGRRSGRSLAVLSGRSNAPKSVSVEDQLGGTPLKTGVATLALPIPVARLAQGHVSVGVLVAKS